MVKLYRLKANCPSFYAGDIGILKEDGNLWFVGNLDPEIRKIEDEKHWKKDFIMFHKRTLEAFDILDNWFEEVPKEIIDVLFPWEGCEYYYVTSTGLGSKKWTGNFEDTVRHATGNCFLNIQEAEDLREKLDQLAILENNGFRLTDVSINKSGDIRLVGKSYPESYNLVKEALEFLVESRDESLS